MNGPVVADFRIHDLDEVVLKSAHERAIASGVGLILCRTLPRAAPDLTPDDVRALEARVRHVTGRRREEYELLSPRGDPVSCLGQAVEERNPQLLVTGPGLTAMLVLRLVDVPVLIARPSRGGAVLAATDFSDPSLPALTAGIHEAARRRRPLRFFHAVEAQTRRRQQELDAGALVNDVRRQLETYAREHHTPVEALAVVGEPAAELARVASTTDTDLLVMACTPRRRLGRYFQPSTADLAITGVPCSVLLVAKRC